MFKDATLEELRLLAPVWLPDSVLMYIAHYTGEYSMRAIAREYGIQPSTVSRTLKKLQDRLPDPLFISGLNRLISELSNALENFFHQSSYINEKKGGMRNSILVISKDDSVRRQVKSVLRSLTEEGFVLVSTRNLDRILVGKMEKGLFSPNLNSVSLELAECLALCEAIDLIKDESLLVYKISSFGRKQVSLQEALSKTKSSFILNSKAAKPLVKRCVYDVDSRDDVNLFSDRQCYDSQGYSPIETLRRLRDKSGDHFISQKMLEAGRRFREDFEICKVSSKTEASKSNKNDGAHHKAPFLGYDSRERLNGAIDFLGPMLSDVAIRCFCHMQGMEKLEKELGWSARSGKIVVRVVLMQLESYYEKPALIEMSSEEDAAIDLF
jgi:hypothetical protein